jgi:hypothetical protein
LKLYRRFLAAAEMRYVDRRDAIREYSHALARRIDKILDRLGTFRPFVEPQKDLRQMNALGRFSEHPFHFAHGGQPVPKVGKVFHGRFDFGYPPQRR